MESQPINTKITLIALGALIIVLVLVTIFSGSSRLTTYGPGSGSDKLSPDQQALLFQRLKEAVSNMEIQARGFKSELDKFDHLQETFNED